MESTLMEIMKSTKMCVQEVLKCKNDIRKLPVGPPTKLDSCIQNDSFRMQYRRVLDFLQTNQAKMEVVLNGERDAPPADLGLNVQNRIPVPKMSL